MEHLQQKVLKTSRKLSKGLKKLKPLGSSILALLVGLSLLIYGGVSYYRVRILSFSKVPQAVQQSVQDQDIPVEVIIPSINIDLKVDPGTIKDGVWQISALSATFLDTSAIPGSGGNTVMYGHNKKAIFGNLPYLSIGQKIIIKTKSGKIYNYIADKKYFVGSDRVDLVSPGNSEELTLYTCWGLFDTQRAVIKARPI